MHKQQNSQYEQMIWNRTPFHKKAFFREMNQVQIREAELTREGYLLTIGNRGSLIIHPVFHNGDVYRRQGDSSKTVYGSLSKLKLFYLDCFLLSEREVIQRALQWSNVKRITQPDGKKLDVAMLDHWPVVKAHPYSCCIYFKGESIKTKNLEPKAPYNKPHKDRFSAGQVQDLSIGVLLGRLHSRLKSSPL